MGVGHKCREREHRCASQKRTHSQLRSLKNLNAMVSRITHENASVAVDGNAAGWTFKLPITGALAADGADVRAISVFQNLYTMITIINHNQMTVAVQRNIHRVFELAVAFTFLADGPQVLSVAAPKHMDAMIAAVSSYNVALRVKCNATAASHGSCQLSRATALASHAADKGTITQSENLNSAVMAIMHSDIAVAVNRNAGWIIIQLIADGADVRAVGIIQHLHLTCRL